MVGVFKFIPPERVFKSLDRRLREVTEFRSEVYQIGLIIYFIICKELPFMTETWKAMVDGKRNFDIDIHAFFGNRRMPKVENNGRKIEKTIIKYLNQLR